MLRISNNFEIDQSGKVEYTSKDTILSLANKDFSYTIKITARAKRELQTYFRSAGEPILFVYKTFAAGIFILLNAFNMKIKNVVIDKEYPGNENIIGEMLIRLLRAFDIGSRIKIDFKQIGKSSPAHISAYNTATRRQIEDRRVGFLEIKKIASSLSPE